MKHKTFLAMCIILITLLISNPSVSSEEMYKLNVYINLWESKLYLRLNEMEIESFPIAYGTKESPTPIGTYKIIEKSREWGGGFGSRWLGLNVPWGTYGIHGTNKPWLIGKDVSSGCIRMNNKDVEKLFDIVPVGTVIIIEGPIHGLDKHNLKNLSFGSKGNLVQLVQGRLKAGGFYLGEIDGIYSYSTEKAVKKLQKKYNLPITGGISEHEYTILGLIE